ncbi:hypothetical protein RHMOL_Rhmol03G0148400 [Rhododendron molle]|uniref:Uncharacterized protein n=1 Tax=Rhododendron molle TaxID=49168 RepID=A0ACC0PGW7_RHOML|nr:hypothetical protein RHMOL_Rhmol03G0148400 [Rhododendron molle]
MQDDSSDEYYMIVSQSLLMVSLQKENSVSRAVTSPAFVHSSKKITSTSTLRQNSHTMGFGSALNIETLVAAAERRNTSMEYPASGTQDKILFMINNMSSSNIEAKQRNFLSFLVNNIILCLHSTCHMRKGLMIIVIPFTSKVLFKNLGVDMKVVKPTSLLKDQARESEGNLDFSMKDKGASQPQLITGTNTGIMSTSNAVDLKPDIISSTQLGAHLNLVTATFCGGNFSSPIHEIGSHIIFNQKLSALGLQYFERSVPLAIKRAIEEVMGHVVQHNVTIATQTTKDLVLKDYAMESDETPIYNAAHLMIASLAGSLAHVTCKVFLGHPSFLSFCSLDHHLRNSLQASNISSELQEQAVAIIMNDNLVLCCAVNQHATTDNICFHASITFHIPSPCVHIVNQKPWVDIFLSTSIAVLYTYLDISLRWWWDMLPGTRIVPGTRNGNGNGNAECHMLKLWWTNSKELEDGLHEKLGEMGEGEESPDSTKEPMSTIGNGEQELSSSSTPEKSTRPWQTVIRKKKQLSERK